MKLLIGIPAYNESEVLGKVLSSIPKKVKGISADILLVDDGSTDGTGTLAKKKGIKVLTHLINRGLGGSLKTIITFARNNKYDILVTFDADGQHNPLDIHRIILPILNQDADLVIGSRWNSGMSRPYLRYIINMFANIATYFLFGVWSSDSQSGFRAISKKALNQIELQTDGMEVSSEFFREIYSKKLKFTEVSIKPIYSDYSQKKGQLITNAPNVFFQLLLRLFK